MLFHRIKTGTPFHRIQVPVSHNDTTLYSDQAPDNGSDGDDYFDNETPLEVRVIVDALGES